MLQEMGLDRDACTEYLATSGALAASGVENDAFRMTQLDVVSYQTILCFLARLRLT